MRRPAAADTHRVITWRLPVVVLALVACFAAVGYAVFPRAPSPQRGTTITIPEGPPANDASGAAGWVWPEGLPGWKPGLTIKGYPVTGVQPVEVAAAQLAAARAGLDSENIRVLVSARTDRQGVLAILVAPTLYQTPVKTCLAALLRGDAPVVWLCPGPHRLSDSHVLVVAAAFASPGQGGSTVPRRPLVLVGVARGDVERIVLAGLDHSSPLKIYTRGSTWGEFQIEEALPSTSPRLLVYGHGRLLETVPLDLASGRQRVLR